MGVPWQRGAGGAWGRPTGVDLALIAIASLPASALDIDPAEDFDGLRDRVADRVKKELKRAAVEDEHSKKTMDAHPPRYHHP